MRRAALLFLCSVVAQPLLAQGLTGPDRCLKCHKKLARAPWEKFHRETAAQLDPARKPNAARYAAATGGNPQAPSCKRCHTPDAAATPVACETCHGPGKGYLDPHQERPFYSGADLKGMLILYNQAAKIAQQCVTCHVLTAEHKAVADAGHPTGDDFKTGAAFDKIKHWPSGDEKDVRPRAYAAPFLAEIDKAAAPQLAKALKGTKRAPAASGGAPPAAGAPSGGAPAPSSGGAPRAASAPTGNVLAALLDDLKQEGVEVRSAKLADEPVAEFKPTVAPPQRPAAPREPAPVAPAPSATAAPATPTAAPRPPGGRTAPQAADMFALRGVAATRLQELLKKKAKLDIKPPGAPARFTGPDSELLALQDEVLALALEALRKKEP
jgi:hypothetical protein